jgi:hypothetical protein
MIPNEEIEKINKGMLPLNIIWGAMLISLFIYLFVGLFIMDNLHTATEKNAIDTLRNVLFAVSFGTLIATRSIRKLILYGKGGRKVLNAGQPSYQSGQALSKYTTAMIVSLAMTESIGTYGLVLFILGKNQMDLYLFVLVSAATMLIYRPKRDEIVSLTQELSKQGPDDSFQRTR